MPRRADSDLSFPVIKTALLESRSFKLPVAILPSLSSEGQYSFTRNPRGQTHIRMNEFIGFYFPSMRMERGKHSIVSILSQAHPAPTSPETSIPQKELPQPSLVT